MELADYLKILVDHDGSDLYLTTGAPATAKIHGVLKRLEDNMLLPDKVKSIAHEIMSEEQRAQFAQAPEMNLAISQRGLGRFRVNIFMQRNQVAMVIRHIKTEIPTMESLRLPAVLSKLVMQRRGLILVVGSTGSGKSTTCASMLDYRNMNSSDHIITIEDPIEYMYQHKKSIVNQREVGIDTQSYGDALKNTLRQAPDVILVGEIRDRETMEHAIAFAETGHLCISTLHSTNANQAFDRIVNFFPEDRRSQVLMDMAANMRAIVSQRLVPTIQKTRAVAVEVLINTPFVADLIQKGKFSSLKEAMEKGENMGMQTIDDSLYELYIEKQISVEEAVKYADSPNNLRLKINLQESNVKNRGEGPLSLKGDD